MGDWVTNWEGDSNQSSAETIMVIPLWNFLKILKNQILVTQYNFKELYIEQKGVESLENGFQNMEVKIICANFVLMEQIDLLVFSGDVIGDINM